jgi:hypothetical protein
MADRVEDLVGFIHKMIALLQLVENCRDVLFRQGFRVNLPDAITEARKLLNQLLEDEHVLNPENHKLMRIAGLTGAQLQLKLESFESSLTVFESEAGLNNLAEVLGKGGTILSSLAGAIPGFGSFAQELIEFLLRELRNRMKFWP